MFGIFRRKSAAPEPQKIDYMIVGLGNPGARYETTRHNAGFMAIDLLAERLDAGRINRGKCKALYTTCIHEGKVLMLVKPQTFMNLSGEAVRDLAAAYKVDAEHIVVLYDDININPGRLRVKRAGSDGGHNGIKNIIYHLQSDRFPRVKIGIGTPEGEDMKDYVLDSISSDTYQGVKAAPDAALAIVLRGVDAAMQEFNGKDFSQE